MIEKKSFDFEKTVLVGVINPAQNEEKSISRGDQKNIDFRAAFFSTLPDFKCSRGTQNVHIIIQFPQNVRSKGLTFLVEAIFNYFDAL